MGARAGRSARGSKEKKEKQFAQEEAPYGPRGTRVQIYNIITHRDMVRLTVGVCEEANERRSFFASF
jgi:hypothetical protein